MLIIYGPTVTGKTGLAIRLAKRFNAQIISADSRQVYKSLDIGTGKVPPNTIVKKHKDYWIVNGVKIYGFDIVSPMSDFSAADFTNFAKPIIEKLGNNNILPIIAGGSGFYIKSLVGNYSTFGIPKNEKLRISLEKKNPKQLYNYLLKINKSKALSLNNSDKNNPRRLIRAIEVTLDKSYKPKNEQSPSVKNKIIILSAPNVYLYDKADKWLDERIKQGIIEEIQRLLNVKTSSKWLDSLGLEYRWISRYLLGQLDKQSALVRLKGDIHNLIRRQKTYFSQFSGAQIYDVFKTNWDTQLDGDINNWIISLSKNKNSGSE